MAAAQRQPLARQQVASPAIRVALEDAGQQQPPTFCSGSRFNWVESNPINWLLKRSLSLSSGGIRARNKGLAAERDERSPRAPTCGRCECRSRNNRPPPAEANRSPAELATKANWRASETSEQASGRHLLPLMLMLQPLPLLLVARETLIGPPSGQLRLEFKLSYHRANEAEEAAAAAAFARRSSPVGRAVGRPGNGRARGCCCWRQCCCRALALARRPLGAREGRISGGATSADSAGAHHLGFASLNLRQRATMGSK